MRKRESKGSDRDSPTTVPEEGDKASSKPFQRKTLRDSDEKGDDEKRNEQKSGSDTEITSEGRRGGLRKEDAKAGKTADSKVSIDSTISEEGSNVIPGAPPGAEPIGGRKPWQRKTADSTVPKKTVGAISDTGSGTGVSNDPGKTVSTGSGKSPASEAAGGKKPWQRPTVVKGAPKEAEKDKIEEKKKEGEREDPNAGEQPVEPAAPATVSGRKQTTPSIARRATAGPTPATGAAGAEAGADSAPVGSQERESGKTEPSKGGKAPVDTAVTGEGGGEAPQGVAAAPGAPEQVGDKPPSKQRPTGGKFIPKKIERDKEKEKDKDEDKDTDVSNVAADALDPKTKAALQLNDGDIGTTATTTATNTTAAAAATSTATTATAPGSVTAGSGVASEPVSGGESEAQKSPRTGPGAGAGAGAVGGKKPWQRPTVGKAIPKKVDKDKIEEKKKEGEREDPNAGEQPVEPAAPATVSGRKQLSSETATEAEADPIAPAGGADDVVDSDVSTEASKAGKAPVKAGPKKVSKAQVDTEVVGSEGGEGSDEVVAVEPGATKSVGGKKPWQRPSGKFVPKSLEKKKDAEEEPANVVEQPSNPAASATVSGGKQPPGTGSSGESPRVPSDPVETAVASDSVIKEDSNAITTTGSDSVGDKKPWQRKPAVKSKPKKVEKDKEDSTVVADARDPKTVAADQKHVHFVDEAGVNRRVFSVSLRSLQLTLSNPARNEVASSAVPENTVETVADKKEVPVPGTNDDSTSEVTPVTEGVDPKTDLTEDIQPTNINKPLTNNQIKPMKVLAEMAILSWDAVTDPKDVDLKSSTMNASWEFVSDDQKWRVDQLQLDDMKSGTVTLSLQDVTDAASVKKLGVGRGPLAPLVDKDFTNDVLDEELEFDIIKSRINEGGPGEQIVGHVKLFVHVTRQNIPKPEGESTVSGTETGTSNTDKDLLVPIDAKDTEPKPILTMPKYSETNKTLSELIILVRNNLIEQYGTVENSYNKLIEAFEFVAPDDAMVSMDEFRRVLWSSIKLTAIQPKELEFIFQMCSNGNGELDYKTWIHNILNLNQALHDLLLILQDTLRKNISSNQKLFQEKLSTAFLSSQQIINDVNLDYEEFHKIVSALGLGFNLNEFRILFECLSKQSLRKISLLHVLTASEDIGHDEEFVDDDENIRKSKLLTFGDRFVDLLYVDGVSRIGSRSISFLIDEIRTNVIRVGGMEQVKMLLGFAGEANDNDRVTRDQFEKLLEVLKVHIHEEEFRRLWKRLSGSEILIDSIRFQNLEAVITPVQLRNETETQATTIQYTLADFVAKVVQIILADTERKKSTIEQILQQEPEKPVNRVRRFFKRRTPLREFGGEAMIPAEKAATRIQSAWRGLKSRRYLRRLEFYVIIVQRAVRGKIARKKLLLQLARKRALRAAERERLHRLKGIRAKERELQVLKALPVDAFMDFHRIQRESSARAVQRLWRSYKSKKSGLKLDPSIRGNWGDAMKSLQKAQKAQEDAKRLQERKEKQRRDALLGRIQRGLDEAGDSADLPLPPYEPDTLSLAHTLRQIRENAAKRMKDIEMRRERVNRTSRFVSTDDDGMSVATAGASVVDRSITSSRPATEEERIKNRQLKMNKFQVLAEIQQEREDLLHHYTESDEWRSASEYSRRQTAERCITLTNMLRDPPSLEDAKRMIKASQSRNALDSDSWKDPHKKMWSLALGVPKKSDAESYISVSRHGLQDAVEAHLRTCDILHDKSNWSVVAAPHDIAGPPIDLKSLDVNPMIGSNASRRRRFEEPENASLWWVAYCAQPPRCQTAEASRQAAAAAIGKTEIEVPKGRKTYQEEQREKDLEYSKQQAREVLGDVDGEKLLQKLAQTNLLLSTKMKTVNEDSVHHDRERINKRAELIEKEILRLRMLKRQEAGRSALSREEILRRQKCATNIQRVIRGVMGRKQYKTLLAEQRVVDALRQLMVEVSRPELRGNSAFSQVDSVLRRIAGGRHLEARVSVSSNPFNRGASIDRTTTVPSKSSFGMSSKIISEDQAASKIQKTYRSRFSFSRSQESFSKTGASLDGQQPLGSAEGSSLFINLNTRMQNTAYDGQDLSVTPDNMGTVSSSKKGRFSRPSSFRDTESPSSPLALEFLNDQDSVEGGYISPPSSGGSPVSYRETKSKYDSSNSSSTPFRNSGASTLTIPLSRAIDSIRFADGQHAMAVASNTIANAGEVSNIVVETLAGITNSSIATFRKSTALSLLRKIAKLCGPVPLFRWLRQQSSSASPTPTSIPTDISINVKLAAQLLGELARSGGALNSNAHKVGGELHQLFVLLKLMGATNEGTLEKGKSGPSLIPLRQLSTLIDDEYLASALPASSGIRYFHLIRCAYIQLLTNKYRIKRLIAVCRYTLLTEALRKAVSPVQLFRNVLEDLGLSDAPTLSIDNLIQIFSKLGLVIHADEAQTMIMYIEWDSIADRGHRLEIEDWFCRAVPQSYRSLQSRLQKYLKYLPCAVNDIASVLKTPLLDQSQSPIVTPRTTTISSPRKSSEGIMSPNTKQGKLDPNITLASVEKEYESFFVTEDRFCEAIRVSAQFPLSYSESYVLARLLSRYPTDTDIEAVRAANIKVSPPRRDRRKVSPMLPRTPGGSESLRVSQDERLIDVRLLRTIERGEFINAPLPKA